MEDMSNDMANILSGVLGKKVLVKPTKVIMHPKDMWEADLDDDERCNFKINSYREVN